MPDNLKPYRLSHVNALCINQFYQPKNQSMKFSQKILRIGGAGEWPLFRRPFLFFFFKKKKKKMYHLNENKQPAHMRYHLFLHYGWFLQNLGKDFIRTNMHTTVPRYWETLLRRVQFKRYWNKNTKSRAYIICMYYIFHIFHCTDYQSQDYNNYCHSWKYLINPVSYFIN